MCPPLSQSLLDEADSLQSDLEEVLQASKDLTGLLEPPAAGLVQSESRMLSRGVLELRDRLAGKLGHLQVPSINHRNRLRPVYRLLMQIYCSVTSYLIIAHLMFGVSQFM